MLSDLRPHLKTIGYINFKFSAVNYRPNRGKGHTPPQY
jgi:hypothetical protein